MAKSIDPKAVEREVVKATQLEPVKGEKRAEYLKRLARVLAEMDGDEWGKLSEAAKVWSNHANMALRNDDDADDFGDLDYDEEIAKAREAGEDEAGETSGAAVEADENGEQKEMTEKAKSTKKGKAAKPQKAAKPEKAAKKATPEKVAKPEKPAKKAKVAKPEKAAKKAKVAKPEKAKGNGKLSGIKVSIKRILLKDLDADFDDIVASLKKQGLTANQHTIRAVRADLRNTVKLFKEVGFRV